MMTDTMQDIIKKFNELIKDLEQNSPVRLNPLEAELIEIINRYWVKCPNCGRTDYPQTRDGFCGFCDPWNYPDEISEE
jgi:hypothetical protein